MSVPGNCLAVLNHTYSTVRYTTTRQVFCINDLEREYGNKAKANKFVTSHCRFAKALKTSKHEFLQLADDGYFQGSVYLYQPWQGWTCIAHD